MSALAADRNTPFKKKGNAFRMKVKASTTIYDGALVAVTSGTGYAIPAADTASLIVMGVASSKGDNSAGADGAVEIDVETGVFKFDVSSVTIANVGQNATMVDDHTVGVAAGTTNDIVVGKILDIDADGGAWVQVG